MDKVTCEICKKQFNRITHTHLKHHGISSADEYQLKFPNAVLISKSTLAGLATNSLNRFVQKYGEETGKIKYDEYKNKQSITNTFAYKQEKYGWTEEDFKNYNKSRAVTKSNLVLKYGEEIGNKKWDVYCEKQKFAGCVLEYFQEKFGIEEGLKKYKSVNAKKAPTLENFIIKYGEDVGPTKFSLHQEKFNSSSQISKLQTEIIERLIEKIPSDWIFHEGIYAKEFGIYDTIERKYKMFDFVITYPFKACVEINGDYWHANPKIYEHDEIVKLPNSIATAKDIWDRDIKKNKLLEDRGYDILCVWELDYNADKEKAILEILEWLTLQSQK